MCSCLPGLLIGPFLLGLIADATSVQVALKFNAGLLMVTIAYFGFIAREARQFRPGGVSAPAVSKAPVGAPRLAPA